MKRVITPGVQRQVVPEDFSFLSEADQQICQAMYRMLCRIYGWDGTKPIVISGLDLIMSLNPMSQNKSVQVTGGVLLTAEGDVVEVEGIQFTVNTTITTEQIRQALTIEIAETNESPSPVYDKNGNLNIYCHKQRVGTIRNWLAEQMLPISQSNRIIYAEMDWLYSMDLVINDLVRRVEALETNESEE